MSDQLLWKLETLCTVIAEASAAVPMPEWPPYVVEADSYLQTYYFRHLFALLEEASRRGITIEQIGECLLPSRVAQVMHSIYGMASTDLTEEERISLVSMLLDVIGARRIDPFCFDGKNHLLDESTALEVLNNCQMFTKEEAEEHDWERTATALGKINALLFSLCDLLHVCQHATSHEFQGPYRIDTDKCFIIRDYYDLKPVEVWPSVESIPIKHFATIEVYEGVDIWFSFFNHLIPSQSLPDGLAAAYASLQPIGTTPGLSLVEMEDLLFRLRESVKSFFAQLESFEKADWIRKYVEMHYYALKPLADLIESDWHPTEEQILLLESPPDMRAASAFHVLSGLSDEEKFKTLERLYRGFIFEQKASM